MDDLLIAKPGRLDAFQIKWEEYEERITFRQLISETTVNSSPYPSPIALMAEGWRLLVAAHPERIVQVHFLSRSSASSNDDTGGTPQSSPRHLQAFLRHIFARRSEWRDSDFSQERAAWRVPIEGIERESRLPMDEIPRFLVACELDLGFKIAEQRNTAAAHRREVQIQAIANAIQQAVASPAHVIQIGKEELLRTLGWSKRFEFAFRHDFPVNELLYRPIRTTINELDTAFSSFGSGYIALVGPPGSGKSTTLTQMLRYRRSVRVVRYYAFVLGDVHQGRGEAEAFLHDLCLSLEQTIEARSEIQLARLQTLDELREYLGVLLGVLSEEWESRAIRTIILIDGLDHIEREQNPRRSLIDELPNPGTVPDGVLFILGTQQVGLESTSPAMRPVRVQLAQAGRTIHAAQLQRTDVFSIVASTMPQGTLVEGDLETIYTISGGHPLSLTYLLNKLRSCTDHDQISGALAAAETFGSDIVAQYQTYWDALRDDVDVRDLLGLVSRLRGAVELNILQNLSSDITLERFTRSASHFFHRETATRWTFFHNSFKQFLLLVTGRDAFGRESLQRTRDFHAQLAALTAGAPPESPFSWERLYHLDQAGQIQKLLPTFTQEHFRRQFFGLRPVEEIRNDVALCIKAAARQQNSSLLVRGILIDNELNDRAEALQDAELPTLLLELASDDDISDALFDGQMLRVPADAALNYAGRLLDATDDGLARRTFDAAEPLELLGGVQNFVTSRDRDLLSTWIKIAWRFRPLESVLSALNGLQIEEEDRAFGFHQEITDAERLLSVQCGLLQSLCEELVRHGDVIRLATVEKHLKDLAGDREIPEVFEIEILKAGAAIDGNLPHEIGLRALSALEAIGQSSSAENAVVIANLVLRLTGDHERAAELMTKAPEPLGSNYSYGDGEDLGSVGHLLLQSRNYAALGHPFDPVKAISDASDERLRGKTLLQRMVVLIGNVWGEALSGNTLSSDEVTRRLRPALHLFQRSFRETQVWVEWYRIERLAPTYYEYLLKSAFAHGQAAFDAVLEAVFLDWKRPSTRDWPGWRPTWKREILLLGYGLDQNYQRTTTILDELENDISLHDELQERVAQLRAHLMARLALGQRGKADALLRRMLETSFGIYHGRDDQLSRWVEWAAHFTKAQLNVEDAKSALVPLFRALPIQHQNGRGADVAEATARLLETATKVDPAWAYSIAQWLLRIGGAERSHVLAGLLAGSADESDPESIALALIAASRLIVPFETSDTPVLQEALKAFLEVEQDTVVQQAVEILKHAVVTKSIRSTRIGWARLLGLPDPSADHLDHRGRPDSTSETGLILKDGRRIGQLELNEAAKDPPRFQALLDQAAQASRIEWKAPLGNLLPIIQNTSALRSFRSQLRALGMSFLGDGRIAVRAAELNDQPLVADILSAMFAESKSYSWIRRYDDGSRLAYARCLVAVSGAAGRKRALELFADDYAQTEGAREFLSNLEPILSALFDKIEVAPIWEEIQQHISQLADVAESPDLPPQIGTHSNVEREKLSVRLLFSDLLFPVQPLAIEALKGIMDAVRLKANLGQIEQETRAALHANTLAQIAATSMLLCVADSSLDWIQRFSGDLNVLALSPSAIVRRAVQPILLMLDCPLPIAPKTSLPAFYSLHILEAPMRDRRTRGVAAERGEPLPDTSDPIDLASLFSEPLSYISQNGGPSYEALANRLARLMQRPGHTADWSKVAEEALRQNLKAIGLEVAFTRPRSSASREAYGYLIAELIDAGVSAAGSAEIDHWLIPVDPRLTTLDPTTKPQWIELPAAERLGHHPVAQWRQNPEDVFSLVARNTPDGGLVLGEFTIVERIESGRPLEMRASVISHPSDPIRREEPGFGWFHYRQHYIADEYPNLFGLRPLPFPVIAGGTFFTGLHFIALNPLIAATLDWMPADDGLFKWVDDSGTTMVESIWWQDGSRTNLALYGSNETSAEGWIVIASQAATESLRNLMPGFDRKVCASRQIDHTSLDDEATIAARRESVEWRAA